MQAYRSWAVPGLLAATLLAAPAQAVTFLDTASIPTGSGVSFLDFPGLDQDPLGQTFELATSANNLSIGGVVRDANAFNAPMFELTISLISGAGFGGAVLGSTTVTLPEGFGGGLGELHVADFSSIGTISPGTYTVGFSTLGNRGMLSGTVAGVGDPSSQPYNAEGVFTIVDDPARDFQVLVTGDVVETPPDPTLNLFAARLETGSPASLSQQISTGSDPFEVVFDYLFETTEGELTVLLGGIELGAITAPAILAGGFSTASFQVGDPALLELADATLTFLLDGPTGSSLLLDNIDVPGLANGDFETGDLAGWTGQSTGAGFVGVARLEVPAPSALALLPAMLLPLGLGLRRRVRRA